MEYKTLTFFANHFTGLFKAPIHAFWYSRLLISCGWQCYDCRCINYWCPWSRCRRCWYRDCWCLGYLCRGSRYSGYLLLTADLVTTGVLAAYVDATDKCLLISWFLKPRLTMQSLTIYWLIMSLQPMPWLSAFNRLLCFNRLSPLIVSHFSFHSNFFLSMFFSRSRCRSCFSCGS